MTADVPFFSDDVFYRALHPLHHLDSRGNVIAPAFSPSSNGTGCSVSWGKLRSPETTAMDFYERWKQYGPVRVASVSAQDCWDCSHEVYWRPIPEDNVAHCELVVDGSVSRNQQDVARRKLARLARIVV